MVRRFHANWPSAEPARALYAQQIARRMATDLAAIAERDASIHSAWVSLGIVPCDTASAMKHGSGAVEWLVSNGHCPAGPPPQTRALAATNNPEYS